MKKKLLIVCLSLTLCASLLLGGCKQAPAADNGSDARIASLCYACPYIE